MPKVRWVMSNQFCSKFHTLSSTAKILVIGYDLTKLQRVKWWELLFETQCRVVIGQWDRYRSVTGQSKCDINNQCTLKKPSLFCGESVCEKRHNSLRNCATSLCLCNLASSSSSSSSWQSALSAVKSVSRNDLSAYTTVHTDIVHT